VFTWKSLSFTFIPTLHFLFSIHNTTGCPTHYRTRHFFNNSNANKDIATKFEQECVRCVRNEKECACSCNVIKLIITDISGNIIKEMPGSVASGTHGSIQLCIHHLTLKILRGVLWGPQRVIFCDPAVTISTNLLLIFVCVPHQLKINIM